MECPLDPKHCARIATIITNSTSITDIMMAFMSELKEFNDTLKST